MLVSGEHYTISPITPAQLDVQFAVLLLASLLIHYRGANCPGVWEWNTEPIEIGDAPERLWDWRDAQFLAPCAGASR